jgi:peptidoglycan glycosyltransferase
LAAYLLIVGSGFRAAIRAEHPFEKLLAAGLTALVGFQAFVILGGITRLLPLTGVVLPFVAYGGSALVANYVLLALLIRVSHDGSARPRAKVPAAAGRAA